MKIYLSRMPGLLGVLFALLPALAFAAPIPVASVQRDSDGVTLKMQPGLMRLQVCTDRVIRVIYSPGETLPALENFVVVAKWKPVPFDIRQDARVVTLSTGKLTVRVDKADGALHFLDSSGRMLLEEPVGGGKSMPAVTVNHEAAFAPAQTFLSPAGESLWGLGQHPQGTWNWRGMPYQLRQLDADISLPVFVSSHGYGILWDNASLTDFNPIDGDLELDPKTKTASFTAGAGGDYVFNIRDSDARRELGIKLDGKFLAHIVNYFVPYTLSAATHLEAHQTVQLEVVGGGRNTKLQAAPLSNHTAFHSQVGDVIDYSFFYGPALDDVIAGYRQATGAAEMWPLWAYGFWQCREHYSSQQQLLDAAKGFRDRHIPIDLIIQDWQYWPPKLWNAYQWDLSRYPEPEGMIRTLHDEHIHFMISTWSNPRGVAGDALAAGHLQIENGHDYIELTNPAARAMRWEYVQKAFFSIGTDGWWQDCTEPNDWSDIMEDRKFFSGSSNRVRNAYALFASQSTYEGQRSQDPSKRVVILTRSAFPGIQRYGTGCWSGDIFGDWQTFRAQVTNGLSFSLCGIPYWTTDTGGFFRPKDQFSSPDYNELLQRWFAWSTFCPILRIHGGDTATEMWKWPMAEKTLKFFDALRYRMLPYNYSVAWMTTSRAYTPMRALPFDFPADGKAANIDDEFMSGPALLVSPVTQPHETPATPAPAGQGVQQRPVYLPSGAGWIDFWTGKSLAGGQTILADAPIDRIPLHVRAGSILPLGPACDYAGEHPAEPIELRVYPGSDGAFNLYEDERDNYNYEKGVYAVIPIMWNQREQSLTIDRRRGNYPGMIQSRAFRIVLVRPAHGVGADETADADWKITYNGDPITVSLNNSN